MSERATAQPKQNTAPTTPPLFGATLQRQCACGGTPGPTGECTECQRKRLASQAPLIQAKLTIGPPNDLYEQEADRVADTVMRMPEPKVQRQPDEEKQEDDDEEVVQTKPIAGQITPLVQRQTAAEEKDDEEDETVQAQAAPNHTPEVTPSIAANINALKGGGRPLDPATRAFMEPRFGHDFSQVRVHTDTQAAESARGVNALAYTLGKDVVFGAGQYAPGTARGQRLLAHELTHVVQQGSNAGWSQIHKVADNNPVKQEAKSVANIFVRRNDTVTILSDASLRIQRLDSSKAPSLALEKAVKEELEKKLRNKLSNKLCNKVRNEFHGYFSDVPSSRDMLYVVK